MIGWVGAETGPTKTDNGRQMPTKGPVVGGTWLTIVELRLVHDLTPFHNRRTTQGQQSDVVGVKGA